MVLLLGQKCANQPLEVKLVHDFIEEFSRLRDRLHALFTISVVTFSLIFLLMSYVIISWVIHFFIK